ncbi:hypothetical protein [Streptomyces albidochromogenes]|uniref:HNH endonuclease n=1 Tax=Streptomyces albidochromogenes TaxID=329524 RepID=A0ABW6FKH0_9ACTN
MRQVTNPDGEVLYRDQAACAVAQEERRKAAEREARRPVCKRCGQKFTDQRWEETTAGGGAWTAGDAAVCGNCRADDVARKEAARLQAAAPPEDDQEPDRGRGWFRRRT